MKRYQMLAAVAALAMVGTAQARPTHPTHPSHPAHPSHPSHGNKGGGAENGKCTAHTEGYNARGTLVSSALTPASGKDRYDGTLTVDVTRANHRAPTGSQTFTLNDARVRFGKGVDSTAPAAGSRVSLHGTITVLPHGCSSSNFTQTIVIRNVRVRAAH